MIGYSLYLSVKYNVFASNSTSIENPFASKVISLILSLLKTLRQVAMSVTFFLYTTENNLLKNAPHTLHQCSNDEWNFNYSRKDAAFPLEWVRDNKFWPSVRRIDQAYGDRNLICSCPSIEKYVESTCDI